MMVVHKISEDRYKAVYELVQEAFSTAEHADGNEQDLVEALRKSPAYIPELSLVAEQHGELCGHILFTKAYVGEVPVLALAPLSVKPGLQKQGIGTLLIQTGHQIAKELGYAYSVVLGDPAYYTRFGYAPADKLGILAPEGIPAEFLMAIKLRDDADEISGIIRYAEEFGI